MILSRLEISHFRVIRQLAVDPHPSLNLITGDNGSGKSSILEAISCMATGHSFRTRKPKELINHSSDAYQITSVFNDEKTDQEHRCGLERNRNGDLKLRLDYEDIKKQSDISLLLPVKTLTPDSHRLVQEGPDERRQFLDWGLFHVEHSFLGHWKNYKRALSQRNQLLRDGASETELALWTDPFVKAAESMDSARKRYVNLLQKALTHRLTDLNIKFHVELRYKAGWDTASDLALILERNRQYHRRMKTTTDGPHRADLIISSDSLLSKQVLSRGQQKVLVYLLHLAQLDVLNEVQTTKAIVLCDDLTSELDVLHSGLLVEQLRKLGSQIFITGVELSTLFSNNHQRFHMEHGELKKGL